MDEYVFQVAISVVAVSFYITLIFTKIPSEYSRFLIAFSFCCSFTTLFMSLCVMLKRDVSRSLLWAFAFAPFLAVIKFWMIQMEVSPEEDVKLQHKTKWFLRVIMLAIFVEAVAFQVMCIVKPIHTT